MRTAEPLSWAGLNGQTLNTHFLPPFHGFGSPISGQCSEIHRSASNACSWSYGRSVLPQSVSVAAGPAVFLQTASRSVPRTALIVFGMEMILACLCGLSGSGSPLRFIVPAMRQIRAALKTAMSTFTWSVEAFAISSMHRLTSPSSSAGSSMR